MRKMQGGGGGWGVGEGSLECLSDANDATVDAATPGVTRDTGPCYHNEETAGINPDLLHGNGCYYDRKSTGKVEMTKTAQRSLHQQMLQL